MIVRFHGEARAEWHAAVDGYEAQKEGLGVDFVAEVRDAARLVSEGPWREKVRRRMRELKSGTVDLIPGEQVMQELRARSVARK